MTYPHSADEQSCRKNQANRAPTNQSPVPVGGFNPLDQFDRIQTRSVNIALQLRAKLRRRGLDLLRQQFSGPHFDALDVRVEILNATGDGLCAFPRATL